MEFIHVNLNVTDLDQSIDFYTQELGFEHTWGFESADGTSVHRYVAADNGIEIQLTKTHGVDEVKPGAGWGHIALKVPDVDDAFARIDNHGVEKEPSDQPAAGARTAFILDPDGYTIELVEPLK